MEISRLIFSKETKNKMSKGLNALELGKLRFEKLKELERDGKIGYAKNRYELAKMLGFTDQQKKKGYQWVSNNIRRQHVIERVVGINKKGKMEFEYSVGSEPDFDRKNANKARWEKSEKAKVKKRNTEPKSLEHLTYRQRGKVLYTRLMKLSNDNGGEIKQFNSRDAIAKALGCNKGWINGLIKRGYLKETIDYYGDSPVFKYELTDKIPDYEYSKSGNKKSKNVEEPQTIEKVEPQVIERARVVDADERMCKIEITRGDTTIKLEIPDYNKVVEIIGMALKGE